MAAPAAALAGPSGAVPLAPSRLQLAVTSSAFVANEAIPPEFTCDGNDSAPPLQWSTVPKDTKSVAILVDDADAPKGTFTQWLVTGIAPVANAVPKGGMPEGAMASKNSKGATGYTGPCPPSGKHRYFFHVFALDTVIRTPADKLDFITSINGHVLADGQLMGTYQKTATP